MILDWLSVLPVELGWVTNSPQLNKKDWQSVHSYIRKKLPFIIVYGKLPTFIVCPYFHKKIIFSTWKHNRDKYLFLAWLLNGAMRVTCGNIIRISHINVFMAGDCRNHPLFLLNICMDIMRNWDLDHAQNSPNASLERRVNFFCCFNDKLHSRTIYGMAYILSTCTNL